MRILLGLLFVFTIGCTGQEGIESTPRFAEPELEPRAAVHYDDIKELPASFQRQGSQDYVMDMVQNGYLSVLIELSDNGTLRSEFSITPTPEHKVVLDSPAYFLMTGRGDNNFNAASLIVVLHLMLKNSSDYQIATLYYAIFGSSPAALERQEGIVRTHEDDRRYCTHAARFCDGTSGAEFLNMLEQFLRSTAGARGLEV